MFAIRPSKEIAFSSYYLFFILLYIFNFMMISFYTFICIVYFIFLIIVIYYRWKASGCASWPMECSKNELSEESCNFVHGINQLVHSPLSHTRRHTWYKVLLKYAHTLVTSLKFIAVLVMKVRYVNSHSTSIHQNALNIKIV